MLSVASTSSQYQLTNQDLKSEKISQCLDNHDDTCDKTNTCEYSENENIIVHVKQLEKLICALASNSFQQCLDLSTCPYKTMTITMKAKVFTFILAY